MVLSTSRGTILRQRVDDVSVQARSATGVLVQKLAKDDSIVDISIVPPEEEKEEEKKTKTSDSKSAKA